MVEDVKVRVKDADVDPIEELDVADMGTGDVANSVGNLLKQVVRFGFGLYTLPLNLLPARSRYHAKKSVHEGFMAVRVLVEDINKGIDDSLSRSMDRDRSRIGVAVDLDDDDTIPPASRV